MNRLTGSRPAVLTLRRGAWHSPLIGLLLAALVLALVACRESEGQRQVVTELQAQALADETAWDLLSSLTMEVGSRMAGTDGDRRAVVWAQERMSRLGFDRVWLERVEFPYWVRRSESASVVAPWPHRLAVTALGGSPGTSGALRAEIAHFSSYAALENARDQEVAGKIVFISQRMERSRDGADYTRVVTGRLKGPFLAERKGAVALIVRSIGTDHNRLAHTGNISSIEPGRPVPAAAISNPDADLLEAMLETGRSVQLELALDCGFEGTGVSHNVIGEFDGRDGGDDFVVLGAHLDSWDLGTGAHDDAGGVATVLAAARLVADMPRRPRRDIRVVLFANEEQGVQGGKAYASEHARELARHVVGAESDLGSGRVYELRTRAAGIAEPAMAELARLLSPLGIPRNRDKPATGGPDLGEMRKIGMAAVDLAHDAWLYFDNHHTANDTLDKVAPEDLAFNVAAYATFIYFAAETDTQFGPVPLSTANDVTLP